MIIRPYKHGNTEKEVFIKLEQDDDGVLIVAVDKDGSFLDSCNLLRLNSNGTIRRMCFVNPNLGFVLNQDGSILLESEVD